MDNLTNVTATNVPLSLLSFVVGISYISTGVFFILLHIACSYLIYTDKEMQNPTYQFMINLSIADCLELIPLAIYAGASILIGEQNQILCVLMGWLAAIAWYSNCILFAFIAFSRWIAMAKPHLLDHVFRKRVLIGLHVIPWIVLVIFYFGTVVAVYPMITLYFYPQLFTWGFTYDIPLGKYLHWHNFVFNTSCAIVETTFNIMSLYWVHQTRKIIQSMASMETRKRETKLLIQCTIIGTVFSVASITFTIVWAAGLTTSPLACLIMQAIWTSNHCVNPLVYLGVNTRLRKRFLLWISCKKKHNQVGVDENYAASGNGSGALAMMNNSLAHTRY